MLQLILRQLTERSHLLYLSIIHNHHQIRLSQKLQLVCGQNPRLALQVLGDALLEEVFADVGVHRGQGVVHEVDVGVAVYGSR